MTTVIALRGVEDENRGRLSSIVTSWMLALMAITVYLLSLEGRGQTVEFLLEPCFASVSYEGYFGPVATIVAHGSL